MTNSKQSQRQAKSRIAERCNISALRPEPRGIKRECKQPRMTLELSHLENGRHYAIAVFVSNSYEGDQ